jgi:glycosyltransferase involved in cell wall biosynthesis
VERTVTLVVPCYNEAERFDGPMFARFLADGRVRLLLVDDGSKDDTSGVLGRFCDGSSGGASLLRLPDNRGKGEAVRAGLRAALDAGAAIVGYTDADLATPVEEVLRLLDALEAEPGVGVVIGARWAHLGADIQRSPLRHYLGRVFATGASLVLGVAVYDTQCGAKLFRAGTALDEALAEPFRSRWAFDVELLGRLMDGGAEVVEVPLRRWIHVPGSKLGMGSMIRAAADLVRIRRALRDRRR